MLTLIKIIIIALLFISIVAVNAAPKSRNNQPQSYDQKQTGDYNVRLHLKDFQIIALLNDGFGDLGDYDYNYDYSDLTVKPILSTGSTTTKHSTSTTTTISKITTSRPIVSSESTIVANTNEITDNKNKTVEKDTSQNSTNIENSNLNNTSLPDSNIIFLHNTTKPLENETLIAVQVLYDALNGNNFNISNQHAGFFDALNSNNLIKSIPIQSVSANLDTDLKDKMNKLESTTGSTAVDNQTTMSDEYSSSKKKRCATGYRRDKLGRCRRLKRPGFPFEVQLSKIASRIRQAGASFAT